MHDPSYPDRIAGEAEFWGAAADEPGRDTRPDWRYLRTKLLYAITDIADIDALIRCIRPGMRTLELGCGTGFLTLEAARQGADALGIDVAPGAVDVARLYYQRVKSEVMGRASYRVADLNVEGSLAGELDLILAKGILHHLPQADRMMDLTYRALKPGGHFWCSDSFRPVSLLSVVLAGVFFILMPTQLPFTTKARSLARCGVRSPVRMRASMQAEGLSPFEGSGLNSGWLERAMTLFEVEKLVPKPVVAGYIASQLVAPTWIAFPILRCIAAIDRALTRTGLNQASAVTMMAHKPVGRGSPG
jgi:2-polyprenyl-3-methyl-5-hydroxy-6-metoxy-1,4-benzoquinol methylase